MTTGSLPQRLGRYELLEKLGEGGMGAVWLARLSGSHGFEKLCIVKTVLPSIAKDPEFVSRFLHEGKVLTQLNHGNIAQVLDMNEADGQLFLALEYVPGVDLARLQGQVREQGEAMPLGVAVALVMQAAEGLGAAHRKVGLDGAPLNLVHRDVSPQNLMVSYEGEVKVIDFGIAKSEARSRHTAQASVLGKLGYMAPEQARGEPLDHRADQYALGIVLWELLTNAPFVRRGTLTEMVVAMATPTAKPLGPLRADVPASLEQVVQQALAPTADLRFPTTDDFAHALQRELVAAGAPTKPQLGEYVRSRCQAEWTAQQTLLTRIASLRSPQPTPLTQLASDARPGPPVQTALTVESAPRSAQRRADSEEPPLEATLASPAAVAATQVNATPQPPAAPTPAPAPAPAPASAPQPSAQTTGELAAALQPRRAPLLVVGALALAGLVVAGWALTRTPEVPTPAGLDAGVAAAVLAALPLPAPVEAAVDAGAPAALDSGAVAEALDAGEPAAPPVEEPEPPSLSGVVRFTGTSFIITNRNRTDWRDCTVTVSGRRTARVGTLKQDNSTELPLARFRVSRSAPDLVRQVRVDCRQGYGLFRLP